MAFRLPDQTHQRQQSYSAVNRPAPASLHIPTVVSLPPEEDDSTEWVLFSPVANSHTASTDRTPRTAGLSRLSDFGSLNTAARLSDHDGRTDLDTIADVQFEGLNEDELTELDSIDDGLHAFREPVNYHNQSPDRLHQSDPAILPTHDGLGTFAPSGLHVQQQLWRHEQYNPSRLSELRHRRLSSVQRHVDTVDEGQGIGMGPERRQRIEQWRMEQSKALFDEFERETRRRHRKRAKNRGRLSGVGSQSIVSTEASSALYTPVSSDTTRDPDSTLDAADEDSDSEESFWRRITRKVIDGLIGIDDTLLSVILGEALIMETEPNQNQQHNALDRGYKSTTVFEPVAPTPMSLDESMKDAVESSNEQSSWQGRLLDRIARELGILVHQICEHPGAFTTYLRTNADIAGTYAGIPISKPTPTPTPASLLSARRPAHSRNQSYQSNGNTSIQTPNFIPTLQDAATRHAALWGVEEDPSDKPRSTNDGVKGQDSQSAFMEQQQQLSESERLAREREYWERELDVKMVFRYLRSRFAGKTSLSEQNTQRFQPRQHDPSRVAIIRQHHPLVKHAESNARLHRSSPAVYRHIRRASSGCASQSTRNSVSTKRNIPGSGSSRHYWDIGGSVGSSSAVLPPIGSGMGSWGEV
ncbi:hypothetical protein FQN57_002683 [Myotisia sp. PD_48]|nr:hypothetical protein FQN57_002683 [Myotisia sp. PD_48]